jgi:hypothetical protein
MKKELKLNSRLKELTDEESVKITGGGDIIETLKCIRGTLLNGNGSVRTVLLGMTIWGMARMAGVVTGCSQ